MEENEIIDGEIELTPELTAELSNGRGEDDDE